MAALMKRRATGEGSLVDVAAREVASSLAGEALLIAAAGGTPRRMGNASEAMALHGVFPAIGEDRWIAIAARDGEEAERLRRVTGLAELSDEALSGWTATRDADAASAELQAAGIAAHASWTTPELAADPHLRERRAIVDVAEPDGKIRAAVGVPMRLSKGAEIGIDRGTPKLGEHEDHVYGELLGMSTAERRALEDAEVIY
jgi:crotonobetainyl-CoA:carnitine CoA-transferase CaiB-like acyl-CoA transferase